jgi:CubicO group peptidase (beta-lactamase class C family)
MRHRTASLKSLLLLCVLTIGFVQTHAFSADSRDTIDSLLQTHRKNADVPGIAAAILQDGRTVYSAAKGKEASGGSLETSSPMCIGSLSKSFTALGVLLLEERGAVDLDAPVRRYIPYFRVADRQLSGEITVRDLLYQESGLARENSVPSSDYGSSLEERVRELSDMEKSAERGEEFNYLNDHYNILGLLIEEVTGKTYASYMQEHIFTPLGMEHTTANPAAIRQMQLSGYTSIFGISKRMKHRLPRYDIPSGYIVSNLQDMTRYLSFLINPEQDIISSAAITKLRSTSEHSDYGMGWHVSERGGHTVFEHSGAVPAFSSHIEFTPETGSGYVYLINKNHLLYHFLPVYKNLNNNLSQVIAGNDDFRHFPSIWLLRIVSLLIVFFAGRDVWKTVKLIKTKKSRGAWRKEAIQAVALFLLLALGIPFLLKNVLSLGLDPVVMFSYMPDFTALLLLAIVVQAARLLISVLHIFADSHSAARKS